MAVFRLAQRDSAYISLLYTLNSSTESTITSREAGFRLAQGDYHYLSELYTLYSKLDLLWYLWGVGIPPDTGGFFLYLCTLYGNCSLLYTSLFSTCSTLYSGISGISLLSTLYSGISGAG